LSCLVVQKYYAPYQYKTIEKVFTWYGTEPEAREVRRIIPDDGKGGQYAINEKEAREVEQIGSCDE